MALSENSPSTLFVLEQSTGLHRGNVRTQNQDAVWASSSQSTGLMIVADGMGGHANGQEASRTAMYAIVQAILPHLDEEGDMGAVVDKAIQSANSILFKRNQGCSARECMGTTVTVAVLQGGILTIANVGDSRAYVYSPATRLQQVTHDHSVVSNLIDMGVITSEDAYFHPERNKIYRSLGCSPTVTVDLFHKDIAGGEVLLLCSDGLWEMTRDPRIAEIVAKDISAQEMSQDLVDLALQGGGQDNIGLAVMKVNAAAFNAEKTLVRAS